MTQITDEMLAKAKPYLHNASPANVEVALTAAYPLIRKQVLEEAAGVCDEMAINYNSHGSLATIARLCATAIRDMAKEG